MNTTIPLPTPAEITKAIQPADLVSGWIHGIGRVSGRVQRVSESGVLIRTEGADSERYTLHAHEIARVNGRRPVAVSP